MALKILLVDDCRTALMMERMMLRGTDIEILTAMNGREALEVATETLPDIILMDVNMPEMTGLEAVAALRGRPDTQDIPIIMVTTRGELVDREAGREAGCSDYITKPFNAAELMNHVRALLAEPQAGAQHA